MPLTDVQMAIHLLIEGSAGPLDDKQLEVLQACREDTARLDQLVREMLDLARIEAGASAPVPQSIRPSVLVNEAMDALRPQVEARGVTLTVDVAPDLPMVQADRSQIGRVLAELVTNALAATSEGGTITVSAARQGDDVAFSVADTGRGIAPDDLSRIFEPFARASAAPTVRHRPRSADRAPPRRGARRPSDRRVGRGTGLDVHADASAGVRTSQATTSVMYRDRARRSLCAIAAGAIASVSGFGIGTPADAAARAAGRHQDRRRRRLHPASARHRHPLLAAARQPRSRRALALRPDERRRRPRRRAAQRARPEPRADGRSSARCWSFAGVAQLTGRRSAGGSTAAWRGWPARCRVCSAAWSATRAASARRRCSGSTCRRSASSRPRRRSRCSSTRPACPSTSLVSVLRWRPSGRSSCRDGRRRRRHAGG